jgi:hypothetical protein
VYSNAEHSRAEQSRAEQSRAEQSRAEQSRAEQSRAEQSRAKQSKAACVPPVDRCPPPDFLLRALSSRMSLYSFSMPLRTDSTAVSGFEGKFFLTHQFNPFTIPRQSNNEQTVTDEAMNTAR